MARFGHAHQPIDLADANTFSAAADGQQARVIAGFNGDGGQDTGVVPADGEFWAFGGK